MIAHDHYILPHSLPPCHHHGSCHHSLTKVKISDLEDQLQHSILDILCCIVSSDTRGEEEEEERLCVQQSAVYSQSVVVWSGISRPVTPVALPSSQSARDCQGVNMSPHHLYHIQQCWHHPPVPPQYKKSRWNILQWWNWNYAFVGFTEYNGPPDLRSRTFRLPGQAGLRN